jgi:hypothetical protein
MWKKEAITYVILSQNLEGVEEDVRGRDLNLVPSRCVTEELSLSKCLKN